MKRGIGLFVGSVASIALTAVVLAAWLATTTVNGSARARAGSLSAPAAPTASRAPGSADVAVSWTATTLPDGGPVAGYVVTAYDATTDAPRAIGAGCSGVLATTTCTEVGAPTGSWRYRVAGRQLLWTGPASAVSNTVTIDTSAPSVAVTFPAATAYTTTSWNAGCSSSICGTASDAQSGVTGVVVSIRQGSGSYWNGTSFSSVTEVLLPATGTTSWSLPFAASGFPADGSYTVRAVAANGGGTTGTASTTATLDLTAPSITTTFPANGATYRAASWNAGCTSAICGTASDTGSGVASVAVSIRRVSTGSYWNGTSFASATEVLLPASGTTSWSRAFAASGFPADGQYTTRAVATDGVGQTGSSSATFTIDNTSPAPSALALVNGGALGVLGLASPGDQVVITYTEPLATSSLCSAWSGAGNQSLSGAGVVVTITSAGTLGLNDVLTVTAGGTCTLNLGPVSLGGDYVLLGSATWSGSGGSSSTVAWNATSRTITVTLGSLASGTPLGVPVLPGTATYTPNAAITDVAGNGIVTTPFNATSQRL